MQFSKFFLYLWTLILYCILHGDGHRNVRLQDRLCADKLWITLQRPFVSEQSITITEDRESAAVISQVWNRTLPGISSSKKLKNDCHFRVLTVDRPPRGIVTVITRLKFRLDPLTGKCLDYIEFLGGNRSPSERICSEISSDGPGRLIFDQRDRDVSVHVHIDKHRILEPLELRMVMTAHSVCRDADDFLCDPKDPFSCISKHLVHDNITNCLYPCRDEVSCFHDAISAEVIDTTNVAISAITSLVFTMLGVGFCVWICWKYWNCITVQQHAHEASARAQHQRRGQRDPVIELPTAPTYERTSNFQQNHLQTVEQPPQTPKDLPPSYESLFPES